MNEPVRTIVPYLPPSVLGKLTAFIKTKQNEGLSLTRALRSLDAAWRNEPWSLQLRTTALVLADLLDQGWVITVHEDAIELAPPGLRGASETAEDAKLRLRTALQIGQQRQLLDPSVQRFLARVTATRWRGGVKASVLDLVENGAELANALAAIRDRPPEASLAALKDVVDPSLEVITDDARCSTTGIRLLDIWRFFRHTWSLEYRSMPGRQLPVLIRNEARPNRPVIGIAQLASPVLRTKPRDNWLRWTPAPFIDALQQGLWPIDDAMDALHTRLQQSVSEVRWDDLVTDAEVANPTQNVVFRLEQRAAGAAAERENRLREVYKDFDGKVRSQRDDADHNWSDQQWREASQEVLYIRKRTETLARLLDANIVFQEVGRSAKGDDLLARFLAHRRGPLALSAALREVRKAGLASQIADLSVCGAVAPYNLLLGGKLVALLAASQEAHDAWRIRYEGQVSVISSQMAGRAIRRSSDLKILTTTSLYGTASSQYNRLNLQPKIYEGLPDGLRWRQLEETTAGFGTVHLSSGTVKSLREFSENSYGARRVNHRFGEGTSPRLRQIREGLDALGIASDDVLNHATPRLFYACALFPGAKDALMGLEGATRGDLAKVETIADAWRRRWLLPRIQSDDILDRVARQNGSSVQADLRPVDPDGQFEMML